MMKLSLADLTALKRQHQKITMITAYDAPSARFADAAGIDAILVGDSAAMTVFGYEQTTSITLEDMLLYSGRGRGVLTLDGSGEVPVTNADLKLEGVSAAPLLRDALGLDWLDGRDLQALVAYLEALR